MTSNVSSPFKTCAYFTLFFLVFIFICSNVIAINTFPAVDPNMLLYYHFNNNSAIGENDTFIVDSSYNSINATNFGATFNATGISFGNFVYNGSQYMHINSTLSILNGTDNGFAISFLANPSNASGTTNTIIRGGTGVNSIYVDIRSDGISYGLFTNGTGANESTITFPITENEWDSYIFNWNGSRISFYKNGLLQGAKNHDGSIILDTADFYIGSRAGSSHFFRGAIDELIVFNRSLNSVDIGNIYGNYFTWGDNGSAVQYITDCGTMITANAHYYLNNTITSNHTCLTVGNSNISLNGQGKTINFGVNDSTKNNYGIKTQGFNNITIVNAIVHETPLFSNITNDEGVLLSNVTVFLFQNNTINMSNNYAYGLHLDTGSNSGSILDNYISMKGYGSSGAYPNGTSYSIHMEGQNNHHIVISNNSIYTYDNFTNGFALELGNHYINMTGNYFSINGYRSYAVNLDTNITDSLVFNNTIFTTGVEDACIEFFSDPTHPEGVARNNITGNYCYETGDNARGIYIKNSDANNDNSYSFNNITTYGTSAWGVQLRGANYNNTFFNNSIVTHGSLSHGIEISFGGGNDSIFNNTITLFNETSLGVNLLNSSGNNIFQDLNMFIDNYSTNYLWQQNKILGYKSSGLCTGISNDINSNSGNINISLDYNETCQILDNYNITENYNRQNDPIWFSSSTSTTKTIKSNLTNSINSKVILSTPSNCASISKITWQQAGGTLTTWHNSQAQAVCTNLTTIGQQLIIDPTGGGSDNLLTFFTEYTCSLNESFIYQLVAVFLVLLVLGFVIFIFYQKGQIKEVNLKVIIIAFIAAAVGLVLIQSVTDSIAQFCS